LVVVFRQARPTRDPNRRGRRMQDRHWRQTLTKTNKRPSIIRMPQAGEQRGDLRSISGSDNDDFSNILANQVVKALWLEHCDLDERTQLMEAALAAMIGMKPRDELEGMADQPADRDP
jgi:predicted outer membrane lipoprotein